MPTDSIMSIKVGVEFVNIKETYNFNKDLLCFYKLNNYQPHEGDRVAIFLAGWTQVKDYVIFQWAPVTNVHSNLLSVTFDHTILPKNTVDLFQFCYISGSNEVQAASSTFQFSESQSIAANESITPETKEERFNRAVEMLKDSLNMIRSSFRTDGFVKELEESVNQLQSTVASQEKEIITLRSKLIQGSEEYKKLYLEKCKIEKKYKKLASSLKSAPIVKTDSEESANLYNQLDKLDNNELLDFELQKLLVDFDPEKQQNTHYYQSHNQHFKVRPRRIMIPEGPLTNFEDNQHSWIPDLESIPPFPTLPAFEINK